ncbi:CoA ester lyase [Rhodoferax sp. TS-BS-61-7]|uniref:HpcH/HpaI aldolase/citrate lyase family protein n=1 Tax=Rhodoferax sp. TS-BS-61-7 TaxID=2094194 RepID=UPI000CF6DC27|nr:aldolase/citrate lyase family protein [Rhodoferax sp. TS-BS-61-7]PQA78996.1 CoA ester lyase [Rhodoferax sp. TS-BS-61-7]
MAHPREILLGAQGAAGLLPVCDHYSGVEARMVKSLQLQAEMTEEFGACVFDVTLDCEDGAPVGGEDDHANMVVALANAAQTAPNLIAKGLRRRIGVRVHAVDHAEFAADVQTVVGLAGAALSYLMVPKVETLWDVERAVAAMDAATALGVAPLPLHVLIESSAAVHRAFEIAAHPRVQSISFGLMDFVSSHGGAIPSSAMGVRRSDDSDTLDQFHHPLVLRAKLDIASACHAHGKVPSHCVVTEFKDVAALQRAARSASRALGYTRMWSIHPDQIRPIVEAMAPDAEEVALAAHIVQQAQRAEWAPISVDGKLHDRASYRYFWQVLERAHQTGRVLPDDVLSYFLPVVH